MDTIKAKTMLSGVKKGGKPCYRLIVKDSQILTQVEFIKRLAEGLNRTQAEARFINDIYGQIFAEAIIQNKIVNTGNIRGFLTVGGSLPSAVAETDPINNPVKVALVASGDLARAVRGVLAVNDTKFIEAVLYTVQYGNSRELNTIEGTGLIKINGRGLWLNQDADDEGVWLETLGGEIVSDKATISANSTNIIDCSFSELPSTLETDQYRLVITTRDGNSSSQYGAVRLSRIVTIVGQNH